LAQAKNYLVAYNLATGLLINFGSTSLQYKIFNPKYTYPVNPEIHLNPDPDNCANRKAQALRDVAEKWDISNPNRFMNLLLSFLLNVKMKMIPPILKHKI